MLPGSPGNPSTKVLLVKYSGSKAGRISSNCLLTSQMSSAETSSTTVWERVCWTMFAEITKTKSSGAKLYRVVSSRIRDGKPRSWSIPAIYQILTFLRGRAVCMCVCVCVRERERERERDSLECKTQAQRKLEWEIRKKDSSLNNLRSSIRELR